MRGRSIPSLLLLAVSACATPPVAHPMRLKTGTPESAGFSSVRLARIDSSLSTWVAKGDIAGGVGLVVRNGTIVYYRAVGYNDLASKAPLAPDGIFRIASQTKAITSVAAMMLYEEGKFLLDDPISKYIPAFAHQKALQVGPKGDTTLVPVTRPITVRDLLTHTSGLSYPSGGARAFYGKQGVTAAHALGVDLKNEKLSDVIPRMAGAPLIHQPGAAWSYGFSVDVLGHLVEVWSGQTLDEFFRRRIFEPLGMRDTYFNVPEAKAGRLVNFFQADSTGRLTQETVLRFPGGLDSLALDYPLRSKVYFAGGGGLSSTILDYAAFLQMMLNGGEYNGVRLLSPNTVRMMTGNRIGDLAIDAIGTKFGLGFSVATEISYGHKPASPGSFAWGGAFATLYWVDPSHNLVALLYRQSWGGDRAGVADRFPVLVYQALVD